ncbi:MAG: 4-hydroxy-tetrahydrodipicolinate reductase [Clostridia bacterium]|nr:4-hydroxy-tetrahydrodipicolinate reductase [Clostridia bacterium]
MIKILLVGALGMMGKNVASCVAGDEDCQIICGIDVNKAELSFPVFTDFADVKSKPDVIIDFSHVSVLDSILKYATDNNIPCVLATTGYSPEQVEKIKAAAKVIPVFFTANMSLGVNLICSLAKKAAAFLGGDFDIEIIEKHHNQKLDAPSGTALMLANAVNSQFNDKYNYEYDRHSKRQKRPKNEIGIHSVRGGTIVGEHDVVFAGCDEVITVSHSAYSKQVFAAGAVKAAKFMAGKDAGLYDMNHILGIE